MGGQVGQTFRQSVHYKLLQNCKYCRSDTLILIDLMMRQIVSRETFVELLQWKWNIGFGWHMDAIKMR